MLGVINHPQGRRRYWGVRGDGARSATTIDGIVPGEPREVPLSAVDRLVDARYMAWPPLQTNAEAILADVATAVEASIDFLADLLEGRIDVLLSQGGEVWDLAAEICSCRPRRRPVPRSCRRAQAGPARWHLHTQH